MMEEDHDTLSEVGTRMETHIETGGGNQLLSKAEGEVSEEPPRTPATPETPVGRILRFHTDKHSTPISTNFTTLATPGCQDDSLAGVHSPIHLVTNPPPHHPPPPVGCQSPRLDNHHHPSTPTTKTTPHPLQPADDIKTTTNPPTNHPEVKPCSYVADVCDIHGPGAKLRWKYRKDKTANLGLTRVYFRVCDTGLGKKKFIQQTLSSAIRKTPGVRRGVSQGDTMQEEG